MGMESQLTLAANAALLGRTAAACLAAALTCIVAGPPVIAWLKSRFTERIVSDSPTLNALHAGKRGTPTLGGILIVAALTIGFSLCHDAPLPERLLAIAVTNLFGLLGGIDDWIKATTKRQGLTVRQKLAGQILLALGTAVAVAFRQPTATDASLITQISLVLWFSFVLVATCNAVNLTDGLDGLAAGSTAISAAALAIVFLKSDAAAATGQQAAVLASVAAAFLWFNRYPARVFMGDAGAFAMGATLCLLCLQARREWLLCTAGAVFAAETLSVIAQVTWFKCTRRRLLLCSPLHNHFVFRKIAEQKIVRAFWAAGMLAAAATVIQAG